MSKNKVNFFFKKGQTPWEQGGLVLVGEVIYIIARSDVGKCLLISLDTGNRWGDPMSLAELQRHMECDSGREVSYLGFMEINLNLVSN